MIPQLSVEASNIQHLIQVGTWFWRWNMQTGRCHLPIIRSVRVRDADTAYKWMRLKESGEGWVSILLRRVLADDSTQLHCTISPGGYLSLSAARERCSFRVRHWTYSKQTRPASLWIPFKAFKCGVSRIYVEDRKWHYSINTVLLYWLCCIYHVYFCIYFHSSFLLFFLLSSFRGFFLFHQFLYYFHLSCLLLLFYSSFILSSYLYSFFFFRFCFQFSFFPLHCSFTFVFP